MLACETKSENRRLVVSHTNSSSYPVKKQTLERETGAIFNTRRKIRHVYDMMHGIAICGLT